MYVFKCLINEEWRDGVTDQGQFDIFRGMFRKIVLRVCLSAHANSEQSIANTRNRIDFKAALGKDAALMATIRRCTQAHTRHTTPTIAVVSGT